MKHFILLVFLAAGPMLRAQGLKPKSVYVSYFGETVTHPGLKVGVTYQLIDWEKSKIRRNGTEKVVFKSLDLSPAIGFFYHTNYQTGLFVLPELSYRRMKANGNHIVFGVGAGYMRTFIPNVYELRPGEGIERVQEGNDYFITNYSIAFGRDLSARKGLPVSVFVKPQLLNALLRIPHYSLPLFRYKPYHLFRGNVYHHSGGNFTSYSAAKFTR